MDQRARIVEEAMSWMRTPYHHHAQIKGVGVDCAHLLIGVAAAVGVVDSVEPGNYPRDWHLHRDDERFVEWMDRYGRRVDDALPGDVLLWRFGRCFSHGSILVAPGVVAHAYIGRGVIRTRLTEAPLAGRLSMAWSLIP